MAGGFAPSSSGKVYEGRVTLSVVLACLVAASGGLIFGYDVGISGGVTSMDSFLSLFFPKILSSKKDKNNYCRYDNQELQLFTSSLYLAGLMLTLLASPVTRNYGRRPSMIIAGLSYMVGGALDGGAQNITMLIVGRIMLGFGVGFANQAVPLYLSEMAPAHRRGSLNTMFQLACTIGILVANVINYGTQRVQWGWRMSLGLAAVPGFILAMGGFFLPETPNNLIERGHMEAGRKVLEKIRGTTNVDEEFNDIIIASANARMVKNPMCTLFSRRYRPHLVMAILIPFFQQFTGINVIEFYAPQLFKTIGYGSSASLLSAVIIGVVMCACTIIASGLVDRVGRRVLFWQGGAQMLICQIGVALILKYKLPVAVDVVMPKHWASAVVALISIYVAAFAWSWGPLGWLVPSEVFPLEVRSAAQSMVVSVNFMFTFVIGQAFLTMLCHMRWILFLFFSLWVVVMTMFITYFLPETANTPIEEMQLIWEGHWFWKNFVKEGVAEEDESIGSSKHFDL